MVRNNTQYKEDVANVRIYPALRALCRAFFEDPFLFVLAEREDDFMSTQNIQKPFPHPLEIINLEDAGTTHVGHVTQVPSTIQDM